MKALKGIVDGVVVDYDLKDSVIVLSNRAVIDPDRLIVGSKQEFDRISAAVDDILRNADMVEGRREKDGNP